MTLPLFQTEADEELAALRARVKELEAALADAEFRALLSPELESANRHLQAANAKLAEVTENQQRQWTEKEHYRARAIEAETKLIAANADRARLRKCLAEANEALCSDTCGSTHTHGCKECSAALASTDASQWLRERERRVAEETLRVAFFTLKGALAAGTHQRILGETIDTLRASLLARDGGAGE